MNCDKCKDYLEFHGEDIKCQDHRKPNKKNPNWPYRVGCRKCDAILQSDTPEDSLCGACAL